jgi:hypothetical protein
VASATIQLQRFGYVGSAVMRLPATMDTWGAVKHFKGCSAAEEEVGNGRVVSALAVRGGG